MAILESDTYDVARYLRDEHYEHIILVIKQILVNPAFNTLFHKEITVHPDLQDAIRIDLKLPPDTPVRSTYVFWDCLMFLFSDIRQLDQPNCYAIAALIYAIENAPYKTVKKLVEWLESGYYAYDNKVRLPIAPLLEKRLVCATDLQVKLEPNKALHLTTFKNIRTTLKTPPYDGCEKPTPLKEILKRLVNNKKRLSYASKLYYAFKYNSLGHLSLSILELANLNDLNTVPFNHIGLIKVTFLDQLMRNIEESLHTQGSQNKYQPLWEKVRQKLAEKLWFADCPESEVHVKKGVVHVAGRKIQRFRGNLYSLETAFKYSTRLFYLGSNELTLLDTFTDLQHFLSLIVKESKRELYEESGYIFQKTVNAIKKYIHSYPFMCDVARDVASFIYQPGISASHLLEANLLLFEPNGGYSETILKHVFDLQVNTLTTIKANSPDALMRKLLQTIKRRNTARLQAAARIILMSRRHAWTIFPKQLYLLLQSTLSVDEFLQRAFFQPANRHMQKRIPQETLLAVLNHFEAYDKTLNMMHYLTYESVRTDLLLRFGKRTKLKQLIDNEFGKIFASEVKLTEVLQEFNIKLDKQTFFLINRQLIHSLPLLPYQLAGLLRTLLMQHHVKILPPYELEKALCYVHDRPIPIDLGDMNGVEGEYREDPYHPRLIIRYNWGEKTLSYYNRMHKQEFLISNKEFEVFEMLHPSLPTFTHKF